jgi:transcriptional regulator with XRE-family HTH domain
MTIGQKIKELRTEKKLSQTKLGDAIGVDKSQISKYETGENVPPLERIEKIAKVLGVTVSDIADPSDSGLVDGLRREVESLKLANANLESQNKLLKELIEAIKSNK